ncbi:trimeric intracellular cation channel family protein [Microbacterium sp. gxy059]|uniref:trimeric intracellular cation channel family protein n=1 Tax=Microbacterium sp. gxy059 TaxID=2957199 RepID=UPI003D99D87D
MTEPLWTIPLWADLLGVGLGGVQGAMHAAEFRDRPQRIDWLGVALIGIMIGMGGGFIRDVLVGEPPATLRSPWYLISAGGAALIGMWLSAVLTRVRRLIVALDAVVIGMFGAFGTVKALSFGIPVLPAVFIGACAAVGGGVVRDMMLGVPVAILHVGSFYAAAAAIGCTSLAVAQLLGLDIVACVILGIVVTAVTRILAVELGINLPEQKAIRRRRVLIDTGEIPIIEARDVRTMADLGDLDATGAIILPDPDRPHADERAEDDDSDDGDPAPSRR